MAWLSHLGGRVWGEDAVGRWLLEDHMLCCSGVPSHRPPAVSQNSLKTQGGPCGVSPFSPELQLRARTDSLLHCPWFWPLGHRNQAMSRGLHPSCTCPGCSLASVWSPLFCDHHDLEVLCCWELTFPHRHPALPELRTRTSADSVSFRRIWDTHVLRVSSFLLLCRKLFALLSQTF